VTPTDNSASQPLEPFPVVPRFQDWYFPHGKLPPSWERSDISNLLPDVSTQRSQSSAALAARDYSCRSSGCEERTTVAHICPRAENDWFHKNSMQRYVSNTRRTGSGAIDDSSNVLLLRQDLHTAFDAHRLTFIPKTTVSGETLVLAHIWTSSRESHHRTTTLRYTLSRA